MKKIFCFGLGYVGLEFAIDAKNNGFDVCGTVTSIEKKQMLHEKYGILSYVFNDNFQDNAIEKKIIESDIILQTIAPKNGDFVVKMYDEILKNSTYEWVGYLSTTGVYGNLNGGVACENTPLNPTGQRQMRRVVAEQQWSQYNANIFRLPGIYGVGRNVFKKLINDYDNCQIIDKPGHVFSRVMKQDISNILLKSINNKDIGEIYNVADDQSCEPSLIIEYACMLLKKKLPKLVKFENATMSKMAYTFWQDNKKICNKKVKQNLNYEFEFPNYKSGLDYIFQQEFENFLK